MKAPERLETARLFLRRPVLEDAEIIFARYASDPAVAKYMSWPLHTSIDQTQAFIAASDAEWQQWPAGPYLVESKEDGQLLGGTGLTYESTDVVATGYVFAREAWGRGYATEVLVAMVELARDLGLSHLHSACHTEHTRSRHVLEKCGFVRENVLGQLVFPNLSPGQAVDCLRFRRDL